MNADTHETRSPVLYIPHGGGPLPLLGDPQHAALTAFLQNIRNLLDTPKAILLISAHWEESLATLTGANQPELIYDYYGFPPESYEIEYPAPGAPDLSQHIASLLDQQGIKARLDPERGFDHGMFIPLKLMYPEATIPVVQLSLLSSLDPFEHIALGKALSAIRQENILSVGSGLSFHNLRAFFRPSVLPENTDIQFDRWLVDTCTSTGLSMEQREERLIDWEQAPFARDCHPREEHLLPLHVCYGMAAAGSEAATLVFNDVIMGRQVSGFLWR